MDNQPVVADDDDYRAFCAYLEKHSGISIDTGHRALVDVRLRGILSDRQLSGLAQLVQALEADEAGQLHGSIIDAMTTGETQWFRDRKPFEMLRHDVLPDFLATGLQTIRFWSAACATGQEPYSISMTVSDFLESNPGPCPQFEVVATDISRRSIAQARTGVFDAQTVERGLPAEVRDRFMQSCDENWQVSPEVMDRVRFECANLLEDFSPAGRYQVVFCRNVLIYFSTRRRLEIVQRLARSLAPGGWLFLGATEFLPTDQVLFEYKETSHGSAYRLR